MADTALKTYIDAGDQAAVTTAAGDATTKAGNAQSAAIASAASDATSKANAAQSAAISAAASDATSKANAAQTAAVTAAQAAVTDANVVSNSSLTPWTGTADLTIGLVTVRFTTVNGRLTGAPSIVV